MANNTKNFTKNTKNNNSFMGGVQLPKECFVMAGNDRNYYQGQTELPYVNLYSRPVLDMLGLAYQKSQRNGEPVYEYWDSRCVDYEEKILPLYFKAPNGSYKTAVKVKDKVPSAWMWNAAKRLQEESVDKALRYYKKYTFARHILKGKPCAATITTKNIHNDISWNGFDIKVFDYQISNHESLVIFFDQKKVDEIRAADSTHKSAVVDLTIPEYMKKYLGAIIGKNGSRIQYMAKTMKVSRIMLKSEDE